VGHHPKKILSMRGLLKVSEGVERRNSEMNCGIGELSSDKKIMNWAVDLKELHLRLI